jgi:hypothetical protein
MRQSHVRRRFGELTAEWTETHTDAEASHDRQDQVVRRYEEGCPRGSGLSS